MPKYVDKFLSSEGWRFTEDISFNSQFSLTFGLPFSTQTVDVSFAQSPFQALNILQSTMAFFVFRHLDIICVRPISHAIPTWQWNQSNDALFSAAASSSGSSVLTFLTGPQPNTGSNNTLAQNTPIALRRISFGTVPGGVTLTKVEVKPHWATTYDNLHLTSPISGNIDLAAFYDAQYGLINPLCNIGAQNQIDVRVSWTNANGSPTNVPFQFYGLQQVQQWAQWFVQFQPTQGLPVDMGCLDDIRIPSNRLTEDKLVPLQVTDTGQTDLGQLIFTAGNQTPFYSSSSSYQIQLTGTIAYLIP